MHAENALQILENAGRSEEDLNRLQQLLNELIVHDFEGLVYLLYRVDVPEKEVSALLQQEPHVDAGKLLAGLLLKRQAAKERSRKHLRQDDTHIPDDERW